MEAGIVPPRYVNLVFQGGGVRGIAYAGVLEKIPDHIQIVGVGGTSAGSLVAALIAVGKRHQLKQILADEKLFHLVSEEDQERMSRLTKGWANIKPLLEALGSPVRFRQKWKIYQELYSCINSAKPDVLSAWNNWGANRSKNLQTWLNEVLEGKKFGDIKQQDVTDLRIVAADVSLHKFRIFRKGQDDGLSIADAVLASTSIPIFFDPFPIGSGWYVDGGILSNFPSFLFSQTEFPTIGFRLEDVPPLTRYQDLDVRKNIPLNLQSPGDYLWSVFATMMEAHDNYRGVPANFRPVRIETPEKIGSTKFNLTKEDADALFTKGQAAQPAVLWDKWSSENAQPAFNDPLPNEALRMSLQNASIILKSVYNSDNYVETLHHNSEFRVRIDHTWSTTYERVGDMRVEGDGVVFATRLFAVGIPGEPGSLVAYWPKWHERDNAGNWNPQPLVPASNAEAAKGFLALYDPPLRAGQAARTFRSHFSMPREFEPDVARGGRGTILHRVRRIARNHLLNLDVIVEVESTLPPLDFECNFSPKLSLVEENKGYTDGHTYRVYKTKLQKVNFDEEYFLELLVSKSKM